MPIHLVVLVLFAALLQADAAGVPLADCYLGVDDEPAPLHEVVGWLREQLGVSHWSAESSPPARRPASGRAARMGSIPSASPIRAPTPQVGLAI